MRPQVAEVFGVDIRNVKAARQQLSEIGWLVVERSSQTALNRWGAAVRINLTWADERERRDDGSPPPASRKRGQLPPPKEYRELSSRMINQKPASAVQAGARERFRNRTHLSDVKLEDLKTPSHLELLFAEAQRRGWTPGGEAARLRFFGAAAHALRVGRRNPAGLFASMVRRGLWAFISSADEDAASKRLRSSGVREANGARLLKTTSRHPSRAPIAVADLVGSVIERLGFQPGIAYKPDVANGGLHARIGSVSPCGETAYYRESRSRPTSSIS